MIDLRSDTATKPTDGMRRAIAEANVGDEQKREDPSVNALQDRVATLLGHEAAIFVPTATMANQIALKLHTRPGDVLLAEQNAHVAIYEYGGAAAHAGVMTIGLPGDRGRLTPQQVRSAAEPSSKVADQRVTVLALEDTHNASGGRVWPLSGLEEMVATARELGLAVHLDGARLWNAALATGRTPADLARPFDLVAVSMSKGLGAPGGSLLAGPRDVIARAVRHRRMLGGAMRQVGIFAAAGLHALDHHLALLAADHANARQLADRLAGSPGIVLDLATVQTNIVVFMLGPEAPDAATLVAQARARGVLVNALGARTIRALTHLDVSSAQCSRAGDVLAEIIAERAE